MNGIDKNPINNDSGATTNTDTKRMFSSGFWQNQIYKYAIAIIIAVVLFIVISIYLYLRFGEYNLITVNKVLANVATVQLGGVLLLGPLSRMFDSFARHLRFRREMGIIAFFAAFIHFLVSLFFLGERFPFKRYFVPLNVPFWFGLVAIIILTILYLLSRDVIRKKLDPKKWWVMQYRGVRIAFTAIALHVFVMKYKWWAGWYWEGGSSRLAHPEWPDFGLLVGWFMLLVLLVRISEYLNSKLGKMTVYLIFPLLIFIYIFTFAWGMRLVR